MMAAWVMPPMEGGRPALDRTRHRTTEEARTPAEELRAHPRVLVRAAALVDQPSLWPEPFQVGVENVSLGGALLSSSYLFSPYDFFHCRMVLPGTGSITGSELRLSAVVVRVEEDRWGDAGRCGVGAFFVGLDRREEAILGGYIEEQRARAYS